MKTPLLVLVLLGLGGCASLPEPAAPADLSSLLSGEAIVGRPVTSAELPERDLLALSPGMRDYLATVAPQARPALRLAALVRDFGNNGFQVSYHAGSTLTASETWHQQRGNCLAFTLMMVAMTRELGAAAYFNEVDIPPVWDSAEEQTFVVYRHINMVSESRLGRRVVDFNLEAYDPVYDQRRLTDRQAFAQYYSNRGIELMQAGDHGAAFRHLRKAIDLQPGSSDLWSNLGALYSRAGHVSEAEQSYQQALALDSAHLVAISNLERLYRVSGRTGLADAYAKRARHHRAHNPYFLYYQARSAYEDGNYADAEKQLKRALRQHEDDHRFHFLMGLTSFRLGDVKSSREHFTQAFLLAGNPATENAYARKLRAISGGELRFESPGRRGAATPDLGVRVVDPETFISN
ncbi:tetratricopeptide repeat protein [Microbulbifer yueqingensis]|uniref:Tfp pilus assembly protein PilF n=1 Tax=Microbulbifer yueqingensis TaxID=658219 RepID=A0A1G8VQ86_9GAMM|nr:tetratricopeptide repeat protein [Microbulbifer yueqingensis]SDJ68221.1 Tfp pilus assembly protein PilF [Microbulbifer yueqingensis]